MTQTAVNSEQVSALFDERERYRTWIAALESKRATTPEHIYNRVHADYTARLQRVVEQFATHAAALQEHEKGLMERLGALDLEEAKHRDEAAEIELRATVGELGADRQREVLERTTAALEGLASDRAQVNEDLTRLRAILEAGGIISAAPPPPAPHHVPAPAAAPSPAAPSASPSSGASQEELAAMGRGGGAAPGTTDDWQLAFEKTPEPPRRATPPSSTTKQPAADATIERAPEVGPFDDLEFLRTMTDARSSGESAAVGSGVGGGGGGAKASGAAGGVGGAGRSGPGTSSSSARSQATTGAEVVHATSDAVSPKESMAAEQVKTLKCQECGTLNYPTEWYCERCGAELAAL